MRYVVEKFSGAVDALVGNGPLADRLYKAAIAISSLDERHFGSSDLAPEFAALRRRITAHTSYAESIAAMNTRAQRETTQLFQSILVRAISEEWLASAGQTER